MRFEIKNDIKRVSYNGTFGCDCPKCGHHVEFDGDSDHLEYPYKGDTITFWCSECDHEWQPYKIAGMYIEIEHNDSSEEAPVVDPEDGELAHEIAEVVADVADVEASLVEKTEGYSDLHLSDVDKKEIAMRLQEKFDVDVPETDWLGMVGDTLSGTAEAVGGLLGGIAEGIGSAME